MKTAIRALMLGIALALLVLPQAELKHAYAYDAKFSGVTAPISVNVRSAPRLDAPAAYQLAAQTTVSFDGWEEGDAVNDYWNGRPDSRWFFFYDAQRQKMYVASAMVDGNPPTHSGGATVPNVKQEKSNWCWAGAAQSVLAHYEIAATQTQIAVFVKGGIINDPASNYDIVRALRHFGVRAESYDGVPAYAAIQRQLDAGNPAINLINWKNGGGHFQVMDGYFSNDGRNYIKVMDPWYGEHDEYGYEYYRKNERFWWKLHIDSYGN